MRSARTLRRKRSRTVARLRALESALEVAGSRAERGTIGGAILKARLRLLLLDEELDAVRGQSNRAPREHGELADDGFPPQPPAGESLAESRREELAEDRRRKEAGLPPRHPSRFAPKAEP